jgi:copper transport protein
MSRSLRRGLAAALVVVLAWLLVPTQASAHAALVSSVPAANSVLETPPPSLQLTFDEAIVTDLASVKLFDGAGKPVVLDRAHAGADDKTVAVTLPKLSDGLYAVRWRVTSADGHVVDGAFSFQIGTAGTGSGQDLLDQIGTGPSVDAAVTWTYGIGRFLSIAGLVLLVGVTLWSLVGNPALSTYARYGRLRVVALLVFMVGSVVAFLMFAASVHSGVFRDAFSTSAWSDAMQSDTGRMLFVRLIAGAVLAVLVASWSSRPAAWWRVLASLASLVAVVSFSASGHPNSLDPRLLWISLDVAHLAAIVVWLGGLVALSMAPAAWLREPEAVRPVHRFSFAASVCVPVIIATGVLQTWKLAGTLDDVTATDWGRLLLSKVMLVVAMLAVAGVSRWVLHHDGPRLMRRTVVTEAVIGLLVIGLAAGMVAQPPRPAIASRPYNQQLASGGVIASVTISPGSVGNNEVHILVTPPGGSLTPVASVTARVLLPSASIPESPVTLTPEGPNHYSGSVTFPTAGDWTLELVVGITTSSTVLVKGTVTIP